MGCSGAPPFEATRAYLPSCSTRISGFLRSLPLFAPTEVHHDHGDAAHRRALLPPEDSIFSTWSRTHFSGLGSYSPFSVMPPSPELSEPQSVLTE